MSEVSHAGLDEALALSRQMLDEAREGHWDRVGELDKVRMGLLRRGYPADRRSRDALASMLECNRLLMTQAAAAREACADELQRQRGRHRALNAYRDVFRQR